MTLPCIAVALLLAVPIDAHPTQAARTPIPQETALPAAAFDINRASVDDFASLPGIGPKLAQRIVAYRQKHGPFRRVEDLLAIRGIGHKKWRKIRPYLRVGDLVQTKRRQEATTLRGPFPERTRSPVAG